MDKQQTAFHSLNIEFPLDAEIRRDEKNGSIVYLRGNNLSRQLEDIEDFTILQSRDLFAEIAVAFLSAHRDDFKLASPSSEFDVESIKTDDLGMKHVRLQQVFNGLIVWASNIIVHLDGSNHVTLIQGRYIPTPENIDIRPVLDEEGAFNIVTKALGIPDSECPGCKIDLVIYSPPDNPPCLAYRVLVKPSLLEGWAYMIDAKTGAILEKMSTIYTGGVG